MPRFARLKTPGELVHVIIRFVNHEYRIDSEHIRSQFLERLAMSLDHVDWLWLAYAIMCNHIHLAMLAGRDPMPIS